MRGHSGRVCMYVCVKGWWEKKGGGKKSGKREKGLFYYEQVEFNLTPPSMPFLENIFISFLL